MSGDGTSQKTCQIIFFIRMLSGYRAVEILVGDYSLFSLSLFVWFIVPEPCLTIQIVVIYVQSGTDIVVFLFPSVSSYSDGAEWSSCFRCGG